VPGVKNKVPDLGVKVPDPKLEVRDLISGGIRLNVIPDSDNSFCTVYKCSLEVMVYTD